MVPYTTHCRLLLEDSLYFSAPTVWNEFTLESATNHYKDANKDVDGNHAEAKLGSRSSVADHGHQSSDSSGKSKFFVDPPSSSNADPRNQGGVAASPSGSAAVQQSSQPPVPTCRHTTPLQPAILQVLERVRRNTTYPCHLIQVM